MTTTKFTNPDVDEAYDLSTQSTTCGRKLQYVNTLNDHIKNHELSDSLKPSIIAEINKYLEQIDGIIAEKSKLLGWEANEKTAIDMCTPPEYLIKDCNKEIKDIEDQMVEFQLRITIRNAQNKADSLSIDFMKQRIKYLNTVLNPPYANLSAKEKCEKVGHKWGKDYEVYDNHGEHSCERCHVSEIFHY